MHQNYSRTLLYLYKTRELSKTSVLPDSSKRVEGTDQELQKC